MTKVHPLHANPTHSIPHSHFFSSKTVPTSYPIPADTSVSYRSLPYQSSNNNHDPNSSSKCHRSLINFNPIKMFLYKVPQTIPSTFLLSSNFFYLLKNIFHILEYNSLSLISLYNITFSTALQSYKTLSHQANDLTYSQLSATDYFPDQKSIKIH